MAARVTIDDLKGLLNAIEMAETALESGCDDEETISQVNHASRCYRWVLAEIKRRERAQTVRKALKHAKARLAAGA